MSFAATLLIKELIKLSPVSSGLSLWILIRVSISTFSLRSDKGFQVPKQNTFLRSSLVSGDFQCKASNAQFTKLPLKTAEQNCVKL